MIRILIIDDDRLMRTACSRVLVQAGYQVVCAESGIAGLKEIGESIEKYDLVLLDQLMPGMSGMDVMEQIKANDPKIPILIITGSATKESVAELVRSGASDCLPKPFTPEELRTAVQKAIKI
jgi:CheY-like chemotaxis protein